MHDIGRLRQSEGRGRTWMQQNNPGAAGRFCTPRHTVGPGNNHVCYSGEGVLPWWFVSRS